MTATGAIEAAYAHVRRIHQGVQLPETVPWEAAILGTLDSFDFLVFFLRLEKESKRNIDLNALRKAGITDTFRSLLAWFDGTGEMDENQTG